MDAPAQDAALAAGPLPAYRARVAQGELAPDPSQALAAERLQGLWLQLRGYEPAIRPSATPGLLARWLRRKPVEGADEARPNGLYLVGEVGRGKSMLMDLFLPTAGYSSSSAKILRPTTRSRRWPTPSRAKRRCCVSMNFRSTTSPMP